MRDDDEEPQFRSRPGWLGVVLISLLMSLLASAGIGAWLHLAPPKWLKLPARGESAVVTVPSVRFLPIETARDLLASRGLKMTQGNRMPDDEVPVDLIAAQSPPARERVPRGRAVMVAQSRGPAPVVPPLLGLTLADARTKLAAVEIPVGSFEETGVCAPGTVTATRPAVGEPVIPGSAVALIVTKIGPPPVVGTGEPTDVPVVKGITLRRARAAIEQAGLVVGAVSVIYDSNARPSVVLRQSIEPPTKAPRGSAIDLVLNQGE